MSDNIVPLFKSDPAPPAATVIVLLGEEKAFEWAAGRDALGLGVFPSLGEEWWAVRDALKVALQAMDGELD